MFDQVVNFFFGGLGFLFVITLVKVFRARQIMKK